MGVARQLSLGEEVSGDSARYSSDICGCC